MKATKKEATRKNSHTISILAEIVALGLNIHQKVKNIREPTFCFIHTRINSFPSFLNSKPRLFVYDPLTFYYDNKAINNKTNAGKLKNIAA